MYRGVRHMSNWLQAAPEKEGERERERASESEREGETLASCLIGKSTP